MSKKEYLEFATNEETPPVGLKSVMQKEITISFRGREIMLKFISFQVLGALISLSFCPQFGLSFFAEGHGITHVFRMIGDWACALFCGSLFLSVGSVIAIFSMKGEELWWIWRRKKPFLLILPALFWGILMTLNLTLRLPEEAANYHLVWLLAAMGAQLLWVKLRSVIVRPI